MEILSRKITCQEKKRKKRRRRRRRTNGISSMFDQFKKVLENASVTSEGVHPEGEGVEGVEGGGGGGETAQSDGLDEIENDREACGGGGAKIGARESGRNPLLLLLLLHHHHHHQARLAMFSIFQLCSKLRRKSRWMS